MRVNLGCMQYWESKKQNKTKTIKKELTTPPTSRHASWARHLQAVQCQCCQYLCTWISNGSPQTPHGQSIRCNTLELNEWARAKPFAQRCRFLRKVTNIRLSLQSLGGDSSLFFATIPGPWRLFDGSPVICEQPLSRSQRRLKPSQSAPPSQFYPQR